MVRFFVGVLVAALLGGCVILPDDDDWGRGHEQHWSGWHEHREGWRGGWDGHR